MLLRQHLRRRGLASIAVAALVIIGPAHALAATATDPGSTSQYAKPLDAAPSPAIGRMVAIAHNAGDNATTTAAAVAHDAGAVEIDVVRDHGRLIARHNRIAPLIGDWMPLGRRVGAVWDGLGSRPVLLDLKSTSTSALRLVVQEIDRHPGARVLASTPSQSALDTLRRDAPNVARLLSVRDDRTLRRVLTDPGLAAVVQGVSIRQTLLTAAVVTSLHHAGLFVQAWTVNSMTRLNELSRWSVDGVTTDNLTVLDAISGARGRGAAG